MPLFPNSTNPPEPNSGNPFGPRRTRRPNTPSWDMNNPQYQGGYANRPTPPPAPNPYRGTAPAPAPAPPAPPSYGGYNRRRPGIPSPMFGQAMRNGNPNDPNTTQTTPNPNPNGAGGGGGQSPPPPPPQWRPPHNFHQEQFNQLYNIPPELLWANQYNMDNGLNETQQPYGGAEADMVRRLLPPRLMAEVNSGAKPLHMALMQYLQFLNRQGITNPVTPIP